VEPVQLAGEPAPPTQPQPQGTNAPNEAELANLDALRAEALEAENEEV
jgi:hypothetical protein